jgi:streptomycin 6-kinase
VTLAAAISARLEGLGSEWELDIQEPLVGGWNSVVLACAAPTGPAVLKLTLDPDAVAVEERALRHWGPEAAVRVLACDATRGALLLERLHPATPIPASETDIVGEALARLHRIPPVQGAFPRLADLYADAEQRLIAMWQRAPSAVPAGLVRAAAASLVELASADGGAVLLHGDPVPANFLLGRDGYRAIDPRPRIGDRAYDAAFWALFAEEGQDITAKAERLAAALGLDRDRVAAWAAAMAVDRLLQVADSPPHTELVRRLRAFVGS